jgi:hypothetical protein
MPNSTFASSTASGTEHFDLSLGSHPLLPSVSAQPQPTCNRSVRRRITLGGSSQVKHRVWGPTVPFSRFAYEQTGLIALTDAMRLRVNVRSPSKTLRDRGHSRAAAKCQERSLAAGHSITSSASNCIELGIARPSALAVLRLMTSSNLVACTTGRSAGFSPLSMRPV